MITPSDDAIDPDRTDPKKPAETDSMHSSQKITNEASVHARYSAAAKVQEAALCCAMDYRDEYLEAIPEEILRVDYGCGDPTRHVKPGDTVLDLGSGSGKACYILAQVVGSKGRVIGVDCNQDMLALARRHRQAVANRLGYDNVRFHYGMIQDLRLDVERLLAETAGGQMQSPDDWMRLRQTEERLRREHCMIADESVDCVVSNCVLNLVRSEDRLRLFSEIHRVLKPGGRVAISDIVADEDVPDPLQRDPELWSGCISGAHREDRFLGAFEEAGFLGISCEKLTSQPWKTVQGIEFRSMTVVAYKGESVPCLERNQAVVYRGPFKQVEDDDDHVFRRGRRVAVCDKTFRLLQREPYDGMFIPIEPAVPIPLEEATPFDCARDVQREPRETKGSGQSLTILGGDSCCNPGDGCC